jgi:TRAP-type uncharacterized transport system substrate-binding protein
MKHKDYLYRRICMFPLWAQALAFFFLVFSACNKPKKTIRLSSGKASVHKVAGFAIRDLLQNNGYNVVVDTTSQGSIQNCQKLNDNLADIALSQSDVSTKEDNLFANFKINTISPLYPQVLFILSKHKPVVPYNLESLLRHRRVCIHTKGSGTYDFMQALLSSLEIDISQIRIVDIGKEPKLNRLCDSIDVSCLVTSYTHEGVRKMVLEGCNIFSFDDYKLIGLGSKVEGFCLNYKRCKPYIISKNTFNTKPEEPKLSMAVDNLLICRSGLDKNLVYDIARILFQNAQIFSRSDSTKFISLIRENFDQLSVAYPLHAGVRMYFDRDEPTYIDKHSGGLGLFASILSLLLPAAISMYIWSKNRKKAKIENYCKALNTLSKEYDANRSPELKEQILTKVLHLKHAVMDEYTSKNLNGDNGLMIFLQQANNLIAYLSV